MIKKTFVLEILWNKSSGKKDYEKSSISFIDFYTFNMK